MATAQSELQVLITAKDEVSAKMKELGVTAKTMGASFTAVGGAITATMAFAVKAASDAQVKIASMDATLSSMGKTGTDARSRILQAGDAVSKLGFDNEEASQSIARLYQRTGNLTDAIKMNALAMDLARAKNLDLTTASNMVGMVMSGNGKILKQYGIDIKDTATPLEALGQLQDKVGGQAQAFGNTFAGQSLVLQESMANLQEEIGAVLIPILVQLMQKIAPVIEKIISWTQAHPELTKWIVIITAGLGVLLTLIGGFLLILPAITAGISAFAVVITIATGPIGIIILAVIALTAAIIWLWKNSDLVALKINEAWTILKENWTAIMNGIKDVAYAVWDGIKAKVGEVADWVGSKLSVITSAYDKIVNLGNNSAPTNLLTPSAQARANALPVTRRAGGGSVESGMPYLVGEMGSELFVPNTGGTIVPNAGVGAITVNINGGTYLSESVALDIGNMIVDRLKNVSRITR